MAHNSSNSSGGGNTNSPPVTKKKQISPAKKWAFTYNNYTESEYSSIIEVLEEKCNVAIVGKEIGESGTPHLQGYCEFKVKCRPRGLFRPFKPGYDFDYPELGIHWEKAKGDRKANVTYCSKDDKKPFVLNCKIRKALKLIDESQFFEWQKDIVKEIDGEPDDRKVLWYWSHKGKIGKTAFGK